jgi:hypothetical protein
MKEIEKSKRYNDTNFYKPYLGNVLEIEKGLFLLQWSYIGNHKDTPILQASFEILAKKIGSKYYFNSPLKRNTKLWKVKTIDNTAVYFSDKINEQNFKIYLKKLKLFNQKLKAKSSPSFIYQFNNFYDLLQATGIQYGEAYNGNKYNSLSSFENNTKLKLECVGNPNNPDFDIHDLFHDRVSSLIPSAIQNRAMICGTAYTHGGSYGYSWAEIKEKFKDKMLVNPVNDWRRLYLEGYNFGDNDERHLLITQFINAIITEKVEKEQGFEKVIELLSSGNIRKDAKKFWTTLEKITAINESNFNEKVDKLIRELK